MVDHRLGTRILIYSHDSFGLGHLRRCRAIAHSLVAHDKNASVLILSGSPIIGSFDFRSRVDFVRIPGVIKLRNGEYTSLSLHINTEHTLDIRASIIRHTAEIFEPHLFLVDKEPQGLRGEVEETLAMLKDRGTPLILGLRDVMDAPGLLEPEWERKNVMPALVDLYDEIWVYGLRQICDPLAGMTLPGEVFRKMVYTGYLRRGLPEAAARRNVEIEVPDEPYLLITPGGGGDGEFMVDWVVRAYECDPSLPRAIIVFGPFMAQEVQAVMAARCERLDNVTAITFDAHIEGLMARAVGVVSMGGYNTFCEILSFNKPALIVPRVVPRREQYIRAERAEKLGLVRMLADDGVRDARAMADAIRRVPAQPRPSEVFMPGLLDGLSNVNRLAAKWVGPRRQLPGYRKQA